jgi:hypothetical protein
MIPRMRPRIACLIIGDEILSGKTLDTNSHYVMDGGLMGVVGKEVF